MTRMADEKYDMMRTAIRDKNYKKMASLVNDVKYETNRKGGGDQRTALHTAAKNNDEKAISILMQQKSIDPLILTSKGMSALMIASENLKLAAIEELLKDDRVDANQQDHEDNTAEDHISMGRSANEIQKAKARELFKRARDRGKEVSATGKVAILIANRSYQDMQRLDGSFKDLEAMDVLLKASGYTTYKIQDSEDILADIKAVMEKIDESSISHLQLLYAGNILVKKIISSHFQVVFRSWVLPEPSESWSL